MDMKERRPQREEQEEIPLFPLDVVLFPGMMQPLHIFEERYKEMVHFCLETTTPFGVVWARPMVGERVEGVAAVGTSAAIVHVEDLDEGEMNILAVGRSRFRLLAAFGGRPYLMGRVKAYPFRVAHELRAEALGARVREYFKVYAPALEEALGVELRLEDWPDEVAAIAVLAAIALQVPLSDKQRLLSLPTVDQMLAVEVEMFRRESALLRHMERMLRDPGRLAQITTGPFSHN